MNALLKRKGCWLREWPQAEKVPSRVKNPFATAAGIGNGIVPSV
jgi:hypothetical protein